MLKFVEDFKRTVIMRRMGAVFFVAEIVVNLTLGLDS